jgi:hypothetical protein
MPSGGFNRPTSMAERVASRRKDRPLPKLREADVEPLLMKLVDLRVNNCRYPYGDKRRLSVRRVTNGGKHYPILLGTRRYLLHPQNSPGAGHALILGGVIYECIGGVDPAIKLDAACFPPLVEI